MRRAFLVCVEYGLRLSSSMYPSGKKSQIVSEIHPEYPEIVFHFSDLPRMLSHPQDH